MITFVDINDRQAFVLSTKIFNMTNHSSSLNGSTTKKNHLQTNGNSPRNKRQSLAATTLTPTATSTSNIFGQPKRTIEITVELVEELKKNGRTLSQFVYSRQADIDTLEIFGWSRSISLPATEYDSLINANLKVKKLYLKGRGNWDTCRCPKKGTTIGEQYDNIQESEITNIEHIHISNTFTISSCTLLDLISRSPKLKILRFFGILTNHNHNEPFRTKRFLSNLERVYWPYCTRKSKSTVSTLIKRNDNITTFYANADVTCDLLSADALPNLKYLSLILNERWSCKPGRPQKPFELLQKLQLLSQAKNIEALEVRTFDLKLNEECDKETRQKVERIFENFKLTFWEQVSKLPKLKYLAIYGSWDLEKVCRELAKHAIQVELLKVNLMPPSVVTALDNQEDSPELSMVDTVRNLKKLPQLRSFYYVCHEKLGNMDRPTVSAFKELVDLLWNMDLKICFTPETEELITHIIRRGNQVGKTYRIVVHVESKGKEYANSVVESVLRFSAGASLRAKLTSLAEAASMERFGKPSFSNFQVWGLEQIANNRDSTMFQKLQTSWNFYDSIFDIGNNFAEGCSDTDV